jgi:uncharacterized protein
MFANRVTAEVVLPAQAMVNGEAVKGFLGIDFGAQQAGTTVICFRERGLFRFERSTKGEDADTWLEDMIRRLRPAAVYMDAPLSLPGAYFGNGTDWFYRHADRLARGMSPMFLGGLTARAMRLSERWRSQGIAVHEAYPAALVRTEWDFLRITPGRAIPPHKIRLMAGMFMLPPPSPKDRHEADAWLCWLIGLRHQSGQAHVIGEASEGVILA